MTSSDHWPQVDSMPSVEPSSVEPSTDLFVGDLLGDELIDIYNAAVVGGGDDDAMNEIPSLLAPTPEVKKEQPGITEQPTSSHDDGFGAFRSSNSFNDLTLLPQPPVAPLVAPPTTSLLPSIAPHSVVSNEASKKRTLEAATAETHAPKRRANPTKEHITAPPPLKARSKAPVSGAPVQTAIRPNVPGRQQSKKDTPNPLTLNKPQPSTIAAKIQHTKKPAHPAVVPSSTIVTPLVPITGKEADHLKTAAASPPALSNPPTEADFKCVAQAAVSNLIMNAGNAASADTANAAVGKDGTKVDTSTEHVKALTGSNWVSVCSGGDPNTNTTSNADKMNNRARRQNLTPDERARQNRDRNREHARNTRLRKKAYVEELKRTLTALVAQRDAAELEKRHTVQRELEQREVRFRVIEEFLKLRARNERNFARWAAILEDRFTFTLPLTEFRSMVHPESSQAINGVEQVLSGVAEAMADSNHLDTFIQNLSKHDEKDAIAFAYSCDRKKFLMDNCYAVLEWTASTHGAMKQGASSEVTMKGSVKAHFSPASNKLISVSLAYDTGIVVSQVNQILKYKEGCSDEVAAAQVAACEADAILDSLQMPHMPTSVPSNMMPTSVPSNVMVVPAGGAGPGPASITDVEKEDSSDESNGETVEKIMNS